MFEWIIITMFAFWLIDKYSKSKYTQSTNSTAKEELISEGAVFNAQSRYEKKILETYLPDSVTGTDIYIYNNLMKGWFYKLAADYRYNDEMIQKLRRDFIDYMYSVEHGATASYLSFELQDKEDRDEYSKEAIILGRKTYAIENAFASLIGGNAHKELERIRKLRFSQIDRNGNLAPHGHYFDISGNLKPNKK